MKKYLILSIALISLGISIIVFTFNYMTTPIIAGIVGGVGCFIVLIGGVNLGKFIHYLTKIKNK